MIVSRVCVVALPSNLPRYSKSWCFACVLAFWVLGLHCARSCLLVRACLMAWLLVVVFVAIVVFGDGVVVVVIVVIVVCC